MEKIKEIGVHSFQFLTLFENISCDLYDDDHYITRPPAGRGRRSSLAANSRAAWRCFECARWATEDFSRVYVAALYSHL